MVPLRRLQWLQLRPGSRTPRASLLTWCRIGSTVLPGSGLGAKVWLRESYLNQLKNDNDLMCTRKEEVVRVMLSRKVWGLSLLMSGYGFLRLGTHQGFE